eukprot:1921031-Rhodomonas_salina.1
MSRCSQQSGRVTRIGRAPRSNREGTWSMAHSSRASESKSDVSNARRRWIAWCKDTTKLDVA